MTTVAAARIIVPPVTSLDPVIAKRAASIWATWMRVAMPGDNGARDSRSGMGQMLAIRLREQCGIAPEVCDRFEVALQRIILEEVASGRWSHIYYGARLTLATDYAPCEILERALVEAGIAGGLSVALPWKSCMHVRPDRIAYAGGYGAPWTTLMMRDGALVLEQ